MKRTIDLDTELKARGLFHLAQEHYRKAQEFETALGDLLGERDDHSSYCGHFSDEMCNDGGSFDVAAGKAEIGLASKT